MMRCHFLLLCLPLAAGAAELAPLSAYDCASTAYAHRLDAAEQARASRAEGWLRTERDRVDPEHVADIALLAMQQFDAYARTQARITADIALANWKAQAPSAALAERVHTQAQRYHRQNNCSAADSLYALALEVSSKVQGDASVATVAILADYVASARAQRLQALRDALVDRLAAALNSNPALGQSTPAVFAELGRSFHDRRDYLQAERFWQLAIGAYDRQVPAAPIETRENARFELAAALYGAGRITDGDAARDSAYGLDKTKIPVKSPPPGDIAAREKFRKGDVTGALELALLNLARAEEKLAELDDAEARLVRQQQLLAAASEGQTEVETEEARALRFKAGSAKAAATRQRVVVADLLTMAGEVYHYQGKLREAEALYRRGIKMQLAGTANSGALSWHLPSDLARLLRSKGELKEAQELQSVVLERDLPLFGEAHPDVREARTELAVLMAAQGDAAGAAAQYEKLVQVYRQLNRPAEASAVEAKRAALNLPR